MPGLDNKPSGVKTPFDNENKALPNLHTDPTKHSAGGKGDEAAEGEKNQLAKMQQGITDIGDKLGKGFTGSMAAGATAAKLGGGMGGRHLVASLVNGSKKHKKGLLIGGGGGGIIIAMAVFITSQLPFGFKSNMINMIRKEMAVPNVNSDDLQEDFMSHYLKKYLFPGMKLNGCKSTLVDKNCAVAVTGDNFLERMFRSWQKGNIEKRWAQAGFEIQYDKRANRYFMKVTSVDKIDITNYATGDGNLFREIKRRDVRSAIREAHKNASFHDRIMMRYGLGKMLHDQYNVRRCVLTCKVLDAREKYFTEPIELKKQAFKIMLTRRVLMPRSEIIGLAFNCLLSGSECDPNKPDIDPETGEYNTQFESDIQQSIQQMLMKDDGDVTLKTAQKLTADLREKGFQQYVIERIVESTLGKTGASDAVKQATARIGGEAIPVIGTVIVVAQLIDTVSSVGAKSQSIVTQAQSQSGVALYGMNSTYADEIGSANVDAAMVGSFADSFGPNQEVQANGQMGGAGAGAVPLYNAVINNGDQTQTAFNGLFGAKVYAAGEDANNTETYKCPITNKLLDPSGRDGVLICPEQALSYTGFVLSAFGSVSNFLNSPGISLITQASSWITGVVGKVTSLTQPIADLLTKAPGYQAITDGIAKGIAPIFESLQKYIIPDWINSNMSGATNFVATDMGARYAASDYGETVQRGYPLTPEQVNAVETEQNQYDEIAFKNKSLYARMFDQDDPYSFVTRLSLAMPTDLRANGGVMFSELISDPFTKIVRGFGAIFSGQKAFAASPKILPDPFGITHFGRSTDDSIFNADPESYYASHCDGNSHNDDWNKHVIIDPKLGVPMHQEADNCAFLQEGARIGGAVFDSSLVEK
jgi:hypothetical protein